MLKLFSGVWASYVEIIFMFTWYEIPWYGDTWICGISDKRLLIHKWHNESSTMLKSLFTIPITIFALSCRHQFRDQYRLPGKSEPLRLQSSEQTRGVYDLIPGFIKATVIETLTHFPPPKVPPDFKPFHKFPSEVLSGALAIHLTDLPWKSKAKNVISGCKIGVVTTQLQQSHSPNPTVQN